MEATHFVTRVAAFCNNQRSTHGRTIRGGRGLQYPPERGGKIVKFFGQNAHDSGNSTWGKNTKEEKTKQRLSQ